MFTLQVITALTAAMFAIGKVFQQLFPALLGNKLYQLICRCCVNLSLKRDGI